MASCPKPGPKAQPSSHDFSTSSTTTVVTSAPASQLTLRPSTRLTKRLLPVSSDSFATSYMEFCKHHRLRPLPVIRVTLPHSLDLTTDRIKMDDWGPILSALSLDRSLKSICVRTRYQCRKPLEEVNSEEKARKMASRRKEPVLLSRYLLEWLAQSVAQCLRNSRNLTWLELEGIPFPPDCLAVLCVGLAGTTSLRHLSLKRCSIGDGGCQLICRTIADLRSLDSLDLSECELTEGSAGSLASALSRQKLSLFHETWKDSLRYREPNLDAMSGLRRLTLNGNPRMGDQAVSQLIEAVRDSLWLKALDLQHCGLSDKVGEEIVELLEQNTTLSVVDVRLNWNLREETVEKIFNKLSVNNEGNCGGKGGYIWMSVKKRNVVSAGGGAKGRFEDAEGRREDFYRNRPKSAYARKTARIYGGDGRGRGRLRREGQVCRVGNVGRRSGEGDQEVRKGGLSEEGQGGEQRKEKMALRLDLQSRIESAVGRTREGDEEGAEKEEVWVEEVGKAKRVEERMGKGLRGRELLREKTFAEEGVKKEVKEGGEARVEELKRILRELSVARSEQERLLEERRRADSLLEVERERREAAEAKLRGMEEGPVAEGFSDGTKTDKERLPEEAKSTNMRPIEEKLRAEARETRLRVEKKKNPLTSRVLGDKNRAKGRPATDRTPKKTKRADVTPPEEPPRPEAPDSNPRSPKDTPTPSQLSQDPKTTDLLLAEERSRREAAESKLRRMKTDLSELEAALRRKERETRGFFLVSQHSLEEIAASFERLLEMLENVARRETASGTRTRTEEDEHQPSNRFTDDLDYSKVKAEIRTRVAHLIRKSKSEHHGARGFGVECDLSSVIEATNVTNDLGKIFARSEGDVTSRLTAPTGPQPVRLEINMADSPDIGSSRRRERIKDENLAHERAREIFARVVNGDTVLRLNGDNGG